MMARMNDQAGPELELSIAIASNQDNALEPDGNRTTLPEPEQSRSRLRIAAILVALSVRKSCTSKNQLHELIEQALPLHRSS